MTEPTVNIPLLRKAVEWAEAEAAKPWELSEWNQAEVAVEPQWLQSESGEQKADECGTCYCIAGYIAALDGVMVNRMEYAAGVLGIPRTDSMTVSPLFASQNTIEDVRRIAESIAGERL